MKANHNRNVFRNRPWSAAPDIETIRSAWIRTLIEKVYIAKLAVLISMPRMYTTHCPLSGRGAADHIDGGEALKLALQGVIRSDSRTPFSRASCSRVTGMKEPSSDVGHQAYRHVSCSSPFLPIPQTTKTCAG